MSRFRIDRAAAVALTVLILVLSIGQAQAQDQPNSVWMGFHSGSTPAQPAITVEARSPDGISFSAYLPGVWAQASADGAVTRFWLHGQSGQSSGGLDLPVLRWTVDAPRGVVARLEVSEVTEKELTLAESGLPEAVGSVRLEDCKCQNDGQASTPPFAGSADPGSRDPGSRDQGSQDQTPAVSIASSYVERGRQHIVIEVRPVGVEADGSLILRGAVRARLVFSGGDGGAQPSTLTASAGAPNGYLIVTPDAYVDALEPFVRLKEAQGFAVRVARLSQVGDSPEAIRDTIQKAYEDQGIAYVLLVGDMENGADSLPAWPGRMAAGPTDLYYTTVDGTDWIPDVRAGRLPARSIEEVSAFAARAVAFAGRRIEDPLAKSAAFLSTCDQGHSAMAEGSHNAVIDRFTLPGGYWGRYPVYPQAGGDQLYCVSRGASPLAVEDALASGRSLIAYSGHGTQVSWEFGVYAGRLSSLAGSSASPVVLSFACKTSDFSVQRSLGEAWLQDAGALAFVGASSDTYWTPDDLMEREVFGTLFDPNGGTLGEAVQAGLKRVYETLPAYAPMYYEAYHIFGDPGLQPQAAPTKGSLKLELETPSLNVCAGATAQTSVQIAKEPFFARIDGGYLSFVASGLPAELSAVFSPEGVYTGRSSRLEVRASDTARSGQYQLAIGAQSSTSVPVTGSALTVNVDGQAPVSTPRLVDLSEPQPLRPELRWQPVENAATYMVEIATDPDFTRIIHTSAAITGTFYKPTIDLVYGQRYSWRVRAGNACGGVTSPGSSFQVAEGPQACGPGSTLVTVAHEEFDSPGSEGWTLGPGWRNGADPSDPAQAQAGRAAIADGPASAQDLVLTSPPIFLPADGQPALSFWQQRALEGSATACHDAAVMEVSMDGGQNWSSLSPRGMPYNGTAAPGSSLAGRPAWCGSAPGGRATVDLSAYAGKTVQLRVRVSTDASGASPDAFVLDSVAITHCQAQHSQGLDVRPAQAQVMALPGHPAVITLDVVNYAEVEDQVEVMVLGSPWPTRVEAPGVISAGGKAQVRVLVDVPASAARGEWAEVNVRVTSFANPDVQSVLNVTVQAAWQVTWLPLIRE